MRRVLLLAHVAVALAVRPPVLGAAISLPPTNVTTLLPRIDDTILFPPNASTLSPNASTIAPTPAITVPSNASTPLAPNTTTPQANDSPSENTTTVNAAPDCPSVTITGTHDDNAGTHNNADAYNNASAHDDAGANDDDGANDDGSLAEHSTEYDDASFLATAVVVGSTTNHSYLHAYAIGLAF
ncbi:hypothetical protein SPRG_16618 [Saprolegnia parasitica CBS 223.65]|uniref:RxLR effector protein n=1 Tax=Saprolegnia parasitica (strain CBS 223.65) TaxID=695850 RepID=A0A067BHV7_SAPPC|nr:hypothetical protein SPRG_16618 [Saprolegnia parasitica CBS 223.65]KDO17984.1 hypothetical protein SPRG_16618 [Saprolegnia parasitica CBS 223.65]|eukprot:XP_012211313.1 hypothetical protein SPRG_16618 [Saprolegnia parasitica CBS 223.65]